MISNYWRQLMCNASVNSEAAWGRFLCKFWTEKFGKQRLGRHKSCKESILFDYRRHVAKKNVHKIFLSAILTSETPTAFVMFYLRERKIKEFSGDGRWQTKCGREKTRVTGTPPLVLEFLFCHGQKKVLAMADVGHRSGRMDSRVRSPASFRTLLSWTLLYELPTFALFVIASLTLSRPRGSPLTSKIVWR